MGFAPDGYYSFNDLEGGYNGLVRVSQDGERFERVGDGVWVDDWDLSRHFVDPGSTFLDKIGDALAAQLAARYRVALS